MEVKEYTVKGVKPWDVPEDPKYGRKLSLSLEGIGEPVDMTAKNIPAVGDKIRGTVTTYTTQKGAERYRFTRERQQNPNYAPKNDKPPFDPDGQAWGNSVTNGTAIAIACMIAGDTADKVAETALATAQILFDGRNNRKPTPTAPPPDTDEPDSLEDIDISEIPF